MQREAGRYAVTVEPPSGGFFVSQSGLLLPSGGRTASTSRLGLICL
jgi:hypothetical protein